MIYELTELRKIIKEYLFELDTENNIHVYDKKMKYVACVVLGYRPNEEVFKNYCVEWLAKNQ